MVFGNWERTASSLVRIGDPGVSCTASSAWMPRQTIARKVLLQPWTTACSRPRGGAAAARTGTGEEHHVVAVVGVEIQGASNKTSWRWATGKPVGHL